MTGAQAVEGYGCTCGFKTDDRKKFLGHIGSMRHKEPGYHDSRGRINLITDEVTMPPAKDRTPSQLYETKYGKKHPGEAGTSPTPTKKAVTSTEILNQANQIRFVPRVYTCNLTPIMLLGYEVSLQKWGWRSDMPFENYLDTVIYNYFFEHGTKLQAAITIFDEDEEPSGNGHEPEIKIETEAK